MPKVKNQDAPVVEPVTTVTALMGDVNIQPAPVSPATYTIHGSYQPINWKHKINPKYIVLFKDKKEEIEKKYNKDFWALQKQIQSGEVNFLDIEDRFMLVLLAGYRELAMLRGYEDVSYDVYNASISYICAQCTIHWKNMENPESKGPSFPALADAHLNNTSGVFSNCLAAIVENKAFVRAVRNFLNIPIVGYDEIAPDAPAKNKTNDEAENTMLSPQQRLQITSKELLGSDSFEDFKNSLRADKKAGIVSFDKGETEALIKATTFDELPPILSLKLIGFLKKKSA